MTTINIIKGLLAQSLQIGRRAHAYTADSPLLGAIPELDSMAVVNIITALEEHFGFVVEDDEINADTFATLGSLVRFVDQKLRQ
jgi:acyl carrier protein